MTEENKKAICFDQAHLNAIEIETNAYSDFIQLLFQHDLKVGKITAEITYEKLQDYNLLILGTPQNSSYSTNEIYSILEFVKNGGSLLIFCDEGGDIANVSNLNDIATHLGFNILPNIIFETNTERYVDKMVWPVINSFPPHPITSEINHIVSASGCSFKILKEKEFAEYLDVSVKPLANSSDTSKMKIYDLASRNWFEYDAKDSIIAIAGSFLDGRFAALPTPSLLSSLNSRYGWGAKDNAKLVANIIKWLLDEHARDINATIIGDKVDIQLRLDLKTFKWINSLSQLGDEWADFTAVVNYALQLLKKKIEEKQKEKEN